MTLRIAVRTCGITALYSAAVTVAGCNTPATTPEPTAAAPAAPQVTMRPSAPAAADPVWHYEGAEGPAHWGGLSPKFATCGSGRSQSPIDIGATKPLTAADALKTNLTPANLRIVHHEHVADAINNGHTIQVNYSEGDTLTVGTMPYQLAQYHFHAPSEHTVNGKHFPMEMHLVHKATDGKLAVIGVLIAEGAHNSAFDPIWGNLPSQKGQEHHFVSVKVDVDALLPSARTTYRYDGSLTTPPCSEAVKWFVMTTPITLSPAQVSAFTAIIRDNNRPVQPLNGRSVMTDAVGGTP